MADARRPIVAANWKMHKTHLEAIQDVQKLSYLLDKGDAERVEVVICPPFTALRSVQTLVESDRLPYAVGAQDVHWEEKGAFTGEVSPGMLRALKVAYVIVGHSERREHFGETDATVARKVKAVFDHEMTPILCVGESLQQRESGQAAEVVSAQVREGLAKVGAEQASRTVIAYEPVWAIGTGKTATPDQAQAVHAFIRQRLAAKDAAVAGNVQVLYGGSVKAANAGELFAMPDIDGGLIGGASLDAQEFAAICRAASPAAA